MILSKNKKNKKKKKKKKKKGKNLYLLNFFLKKNNITKIKMNKIKSINKKKKKEHSIIIVIVNKYLYIKIIFIYES